MIMGHRHKPQAVPFENGFYINLGDWINHFSYGVFKNGRFELKTFYDFKNQKISVK
ncbi:MAG: hypothetical protein IPI04_02645 [Ignavibacteria bacterium]|nr:hypothetical protein [Ignavibacteria bacterium]